MGFPFALYLGNDVIISLYFRYSLIQNFLLREQLFKTCLNQTEFLLEVISVMKVKKL